MRAGFIFPVPFDLGRHLVVPLTGGICTLIDIDDRAIVEAGAWWPFRANGGRKLYVRGLLRGGDGKEVLLHRLLMNAMDGDLVDHRSGDTIDNRRSSNLRLATAAQNCQNSAKRIGCKSRFKGVRHFPYGPSCWKAILRVKGREVYLGAHASEEIAARAYDAAALEHHGEFAATNVSLGLLPPLEAS